MARIHRGEKVRFLCLQCVHGLEGAARLSANHGEGTTQLELPLSSNIPDGTVIVPTRIYVTDLTPEIARLLAKEPEQLAALSPQQFEDLIYSQLSRLGLTCRRVGSSAFQKDGGIDLVAFPTECVFPFLMAVQIKHRRSLTSKIGPAPVRELLGLVQVHRFNAGMIVTNTTFTPHAEWLAQQQATLVRLRDVNDLRRWLLHEELDKYEWREVPGQIKVCPGVIVNLSRVMDVQQSN